MATRDTYEVQTWEDLPSENTPVSAARLGHIEEGIKEAKDNRALKEIYDDNAINLGRLTNTTKGYRSTTGGTGTTASGYASDSWGEGSISSGNASHSEGSSTAKGNNSHSEGKGTIAGGNEQHVSGRFNVEDTSNQYAEIVGGGTSAINKKNIRTLDWQGNAFYAGNVTNGQGISLNSLKSAIDNMEVIAEGGTIAKVFDTKSELDTWLLVEGNAETLTVGQNIYIVETDTPDYWWDGTGLQVLETDVVEIESMSYEETMAVLNATAEGVI